jgi:hypothetical protein
MNTTKSGTSFDLSNRDVFQSSLTKSMELMFEFFFIDWTIWNPSLDIFRVSKMIRNETYRILFAGTSLIPEPRVSMPEQSLSKPKPEQA